ncbi:MAG: HAMP domain-containing histidine kinase [Acidimicrobiia bacterium]|nr:HAMP domain-containing histidine kinase [Acidimicrobiia bacterium]
MNAEQAEILLVAALSALVVGVLGLGVGYLLRHRSIRWQLGLVAVVAVLSVLAGVLAIAQRMFISAHDLEVVTLITLSAATISLVVALALGAALVRWSQSLQEEVRRVGTRPAYVAERRGPSEFQALAAELATSNERLAESRTREARLEESRRELVSWVSHDLRTPLAGIRAMVEALEDRVVDDPETVARYHRTMRREADRLAGLVDDLFELSRIHAGLLALELRPVALDELIADAIAGASIAARAKGITLAEQVDDPAPVVQLSTPEMARVVRNLLDNAIRHTPEGEVVVVHAALDPVAGRAEVWVQDGCGGIPEGDLGQVFELAYRGDAARTPGDGGAGLGLTVARGLVEAHHGRISVRNEGEGCRFTVSLPCPSLPARSRTPVDEEVR